MYALLIMQNSPEKGDFHMNKNALMKVSRTGVALLLAVCMFLGAVPVVPAQASEYHASYINKLDDSLAPDYKEFLNDSNVFRLADHIQEDEEISVIITLPVTSLMDAYEDYEDFCDEFVDYAEYVNDCMSDVDKAMNFFIGMK